VKREERTPRHCVTPLYRGEWNINAFYRGEWEERTPSTEGNSRGDKK